MWLDQADGFAEIFRGYLPFYLFVVFPIFIIMSPTNPVAASHEFSVYRMQQYDLHSVPHGCRSASFNLEGRSLSTWSMSRHCVVAFIQDITIDQYVEIRYKAGALLLVLPKNITLLSDEQKDHIKLLELAMMQLEISIPVYFAEWNQDFEYIVKDLQHSLITDDKSGTALEAMFNTVSSNGYQIVVSTHTPTKMNNKPLTLHGKLIGRSGEGNTIIIAAHYDSSSVVPELSFGADSNASGAVAILELGRIFSRLYSTTAMRGGPTLVFMLTPTGHSLNYFATKKWLEEHIVETGDGTLVQDVSFVMCLDSISSGPLIMHVSKPPKAGSPAYSIKSRLGVPMVHKKINLADEFLAWHHERFSIKRMTAFTISSLMSHKDPSRNTFLDTPSEDSLQNIAKNIAAIARALASHIYNLTDAENKDDSILYNEALNVDEDSIKHWYKYLSSQPRSPQIVLSSAPNGLTGVLERALLRYMDVTMTLHLAEKREPEYSLYQPTRAVLYVYSVKPAVFDLLLTLAIIIYLTLVYFALQLFPRFYEEYAKIVTGKAKVN